MREESVQESIDVGVVFPRGKRPVPKWFYWGGRKHNIARVAMSWKSKQGETPLLLFSVSDGTDVYEIRLNQGTLEWTLEKVYVEG